MATGSDLWAQQLANVGQGQQLISNLTRNATGQGGSSSGSNPYGLTDDQLKALATLSQNPSSGLTQTAHYGTGTIVRDQPSDSARQTLGIIQAMGGLGGGNQQQQAPQNPALDPSSATNPVNAASALGAAALGTGMIVNPIPGQGDMSKGGVNPVQQAAVGTTVPGVPSQYANTPGIFSKAPMPQSTMGPKVVDPTTAQNYWLQQANVAKPGSVAGWKPTDVPEQMATDYYNQMHPELQQVKAPFTPTPQANAASYAATPTPWAQAPPAPGLDLAAHPAALEKAGQALYAHFGGDPSTATHEDILNFHNNFHQLASSMIGGLGAPPTGGSPTGGPPTGAPAPVKQMQSGGYVPGRGNTDKVPALLTPGEYVIPKQQAAQIFGGRTPIRMQSGGLVPGDDDSNQPPEVRRKQRLTVPNTAPVPQSTQPSDQSWSSSSAPAAPGGYTGPTAAQIMAQNQAANNRIGSGGPGSLDSLGKLGDEGMIGSMGIGVGSGPGSGMPTKQAAGVIGGLASGLTAAAQAYADSFKDWKIQPDAIEKFGRNVAPAAPAAQLTQQPLPQPKQQQNQQDILAAYYRNFS